LSHRRVRRQRTGGPAFIQGRRCNGSRTRLIKRPYAVPAIGQHAEIQLIKGGNDELLFSVTSAERELSGLMAIAAAFGTVREVAIKQPSLENLFIKLTGHALRE
jgi:hypothetical protein